MRITSTPNAETQIYFTNYRPAVQPTFQDIQNLVNWGLTPVLNEHVADTIDLKSLDLSINECSDNIDNNNDGLIDYPSDPSCESATQAIEN